MAVYELSAHGCLAAGFRADATCVVGVDLVDGHVARRGVSDLAHLADRGRSRRRRTIGVDQSMVNDVGPGGEPNVSPMPFCTASVAQLGADGAR